MTTLAMAETSTVASTPDSLCGFCGSINFGAVGFQEPGIDTPELSDVAEPPQRPPRRPIREVLQNVRKNPTEDLKCTFCEEVAKSLREWSRGKFDMQTLELENDSNSAHYMMVSLESIGSEGGESAAGRRRLIRIQVTLKLYTPEREAHCLLLEFQKCSLAQKLDGGQAPLTVEDFCEGWEIQREQAYSGRIRRLDDKSNTLKLFHKWIKICDDDHPHPHCGIRINDQDETEKRLTFMGLDGLRLIDVKNMCIVDATGNMNYTALSHVWGEWRLKQNQKAMPKLTTENRIRFQEAGSLLRGVMLPNTIVDAIDLTRDLGYQYIWIDCLCIMQHDAIDERYFIPQMDVIYGCAVFIIVAASGDNADAGLPGVRPNLRTRTQEPFEIKGVSLVRTLDPELSIERRDSSFDGYLKESAWNTRGWTFQEKLLSPRALIFTPEQVYWECQAATWCEDGLWETMDSPIVYRHCFGDKEFCLPWEDNFESRYRKIVEEYSGRTLRYGKDCRDAFEGILQRFQWDAKRRHVFLWALPKRFLSNALTWHCKEKCPERREDTCRVTSEWGQPIKDCPFPSWSWLGWKGKVCFNDAFHGKLDVDTVDLIFYYFFGSKLLSANQTGATESLSKLGIRKIDDRTTVTLKDIPKSLDCDLVQEVDQSNILIFWSSTAILHVKHDGVDSDGSSKLIISHKNEPISAKLWFHKPSFPKGHTELVEFVIIGKFAEFRKEITVSKEDTATEKDVTATKNKIEGDNNLLAVLLLIWKNGVAHRQGLVHIQLSDWVALDNREWKLIFLG